jgi:hypothetical protein
LGRLAQCREGSCDECAVARSHPPALLAIVLWLCFVGCTNDYQDFDILPFTQYSTVTILPSPGLAAYWPLGEPAQSVKAVDLKGGHDGDYLSQVFPDDPAFQGAAAPGTLTLQSPGIVAGDTVAPHDATSPRTTCMLTNGGYVCVPFDAALNPTKAEGFTLEAWISVGWTADDTAAFRTVITSLESVGGFKGFVLLATPDNHWAVLIGNAEATGLTQATADETLMFETTNHCDPDQAADVDGQGRDCARGHVRVGPRRRRLGARTAAGAERPDREVLSAAPAGGPVPLYRMPGTAAAWRPSGCQAARAQTSG